MTHARRDRRLIILGIRGIPAAHGGFETFAERLAPFLVERGWEVTVYCQAIGRGLITEDVWNGVRRVLVPVGRDTPLGSVVYDWHATHDAAKRPGLILTLGYNTAVFASWLRLCGRTNLINMDGLEWKRSKWPRPVRAWFWLNERLGCWLGDHLIADHPEIRRHLETRVSGNKISTISYGAERLGETTFDPVRGLGLGLEPYRYATLIARPEPENSILPIVRAWSRERRGVPLVVLGNYHPDVPFHRAVREAAGDEVLFPGAIYDQQILAALRKHTAFYVHGHQVGGTNPSLVEALGAGNAVLAHDNRFNRWVAGRAAVYFNSEEQCATRIGALVGNESALQTMRAASRERHGQRFMWSRILNAYETVLDRFAREEAMRAQLPAWRRLLKAGGRERVRGESVGHATPAARRADR